MPFLLGSGGLTELGQLRPFAERRPNGHFLIRKRPLRMAPVNGRFWPKAAVALSLPKGRLGSNPVITRADVKRLHPRAKQPFYVGFHG
jgi:hypothetical protein